MNRNLGNPVERTYNKQQQDELQGRIFLRFVMTQYVMQRYPQKGKRFWIWLCDLIQPTPLPCEVGALLNKENGMERASTMILSWLDSQVDYPSIILHVDNICSNPILRLQSVFIIQGWSFPSFVLLQNHDKHFVVGVYRGQLLITCGEGPTRKKAEYAAASNALLLLTGEK